jgi:Putative esterase
MTKHLCCVTTLAKSEQSLSTRKSSVAIGAVVSIILCFSSVSILYAQRTSADQTQTGTLQNIRVHSAALEGNKLGDPSDQAVTIYLPPGYQASPSKRFRSLYLLHGFDSNIRSWTSHGYQDMNLQDSMDKLIAAGTVREMIVVVPTGEIHAWAPFTRTPA